MGEKHNSPVRISMIRTRGTKGSYLSKPMHKYHAGFASLRIPERCQPRLIATSTLIKYFKTEYEAGHGDGERRETEV